MFQCDDTRGCVMQFWPLDDGHMCSKHVEAWNQLIVKQKFYASCWLITEINILRCTVSRTTKLLYMFRALLCSSSGGQIVLTQHLVSSLYLGDCSVHRLREDSHNLCTEQSPIESDDTRCCVNTICPPGDEHNSARNM